MVPLLGLPERALRVEARSLLRPALAPLVQDGRRGRGDALQEADVLVVEGGVPLCDDEETDRLVAVDDRRRDGAAHGQVTLGHGPLLLEDLTALAEEGARPGVVAPGLGREPQRLTLYLTGIPDLRVHRWSDQSSIGVEVAEEPPVRAQSLAHHREDIREHRVRGGGEEDRGDAGVEFEFVLRGAQPLLYAVLVGDVEQHALLGDRSAVLVLEQREPVEEPALAAVPGEDAVLGGAAAGGEGGERRLLQQRDVVGVHDPVPAEVRVGELLRRVAGDAHVAAGDELVAPGRGGLRPVHHPRDVADGRAQAALALDLCRERIVQTRDVDEQADHLGRTPILTGHEHGAVDHPADLAVSHDQPVLGLGVRPPRLEVAVELPGDALEVVGVHDVRPDALAGHEGGRVAPGERREPVAEE